MKKFLLITISLLFQLNLVFSQQWVATFNKGNEQQSIRYETNWNSLWSQIQSKWNEGYDVIDITYGDGTWVATFKKGNEQQSLRYESNWNSLWSQIQSKWNEGYDVIDITYGDGTWVATFNKGNEEQILRYESNWNSLLSQIQSKWNEGYDVIDITYGDGTWVATFNKGNEQQILRYESNWNSLWSQIQSKWNKGYEVIDITYGNGTWVSTFNKGNEQQSLRYESNWNSLWSQIQSKWNKGYEVINISFGNEPNLNFEQLYPILKQSLLEIVCESYRIEEKRTSIEVYSKESDMFLSSWEWDLNSQPILIKDIDNDGLKDYTLELLNSGGGCGGQLGQSERWTLFGSKPNRFEWTHTIPYRSESGNWEKN